MQQYSNLRDPRQARRWLRRIEVNMPLQPCHQQRWRAPVEAPATSVARMLGTGSPLPATTPRLAISFSKLPCRPSPPGYCRSTTNVWHSTSLDSQPMHGGADATGQSAMANDATAPTHRRRNPGESLPGGPTLPEPASRWPSMSAAYVRHAFRGSVPLRRSGASRCCSWLRRCRRVPALGAGPPLPGHRPSRAGGSFTGRIRGSSGSGIAPSPIALDDVCVAQAPAVLTSRHWPCRQGAGATRVPTHLLSPRRRI